MKKIRLDNIYYETHEAIVTLPSGRKITVPIDCDKSRAQQNEQIEDYLRKIHVETCNR